MEDDDIEYDITFPTPVSSQILDDLVERKEPVVILLGWLGCKERHLSKYGQIYDQRGCITIQYTSPRDVAFFDEDKLQTTACKILDLINDYSLVESPILFHIFSNNGSYVYSTIVQLLTSGDKRYHNLHVCGVVIDSAPGKARLTNAAKAYVSSHRVNSVLRYIIMLAMLIYLAITGLKANLMMTLFPAIKKKNKHFLYENMAEDQTRWPMLFLYSTEDTVILAKDVEDMIQRRRKLGVPIFSVKWDDTAHVGHLLKHSDEYNKTCGDFVSYCLGRENKHLSSNQCA